MLHTSETLILAKLTPYDSEKFYNAKIPYTGATGLTEGSCGDNGPYIATYISELFNATKAMHWHQFEVKKEDNNQWIVSKIDKHEE